MKKVTNSDIERILELKAHLREKYQALVSAPKKAFFYGIADYVVFVSESKYTHEIIINKIIAEREKWQKSLAAFENPAVKELDKTYSAIRNYIKKNNVKHAHTSSLLDDYDGIVQGRITTNQSIATARFGRLRSIIEAINDLPKHNDFVKLYAVITPNGLISEYKLSNAYKVFTEKEDRLKSEREISWWWNWNELSVLFQVAYQPNETLEMMDGDPARWWDMLNFHGLIGDLKKATSESEDKLPTHFVFSDYKHHLIRVNEFLLDNLQLYITGVTDDTEVSKEIKRAIPTIPADYKTKFTFDYRGIYYDGKPVLEFPSYQKVQYGNAEQPPIKRRAIIKYLFDNRQELVAGEIIIEGILRSNDDIKAAAKIGDIHREMTRVKKIIKETAHSTYIELNDKKIRGSNKKYYQLITRTDVA